MSRRIINVAVLAISLAMLTGTVCQVVEQPLTPAQVCSAIANCSEYSSILGAQKALFQLACPIGLKVVQNRDAACYSCVAQNSCNIENCVDSCSTLIGSASGASGASGILGSLVPLSSYQATEASDPSEGDVLPAP